MGIVTRSPVGSGRPGATTEPGRMPSPTRGNGSTPYRETATSGPLPPSNEDYGVRIAALEAALITSRAQADEGMASIARSNQLLQDQVLTLQTGLLTAECTIRALKGQLMALSNSVEKMGDAVFHPTLDSDSEGRLRTLEVGLRDIEDAVQRHSRQMALEKEQAQGKGDSVLLVAHVPEGPKALDTVRQAVARTGCDQGSIICVTQLGSSRPQGSAPSALDQSRAAAAATAAAAAAAGMPSGGASAEAGPSNAPVTSPTQRRITCLVKVRAPEVKSHALRNKGHLKGQKDVGGVFLDPYFSKPTELRLYKALKAEEGRMRKQGKRFKWAGPLDLQEQLPNGTWIPTTVTPPLSAGASARGHRGNSKGQGGTGRGPLQDCPPPPATTGSGDSAPTAATAAGPPAAAAAAPPAAAAAAPSTAATAAAPTAAAGPAEGRRDGGGKARGRGRGKSPHSRAGCSQGPSRLH